MKDGENFILVMSYCITNTIMNYYINAAAIIINILLATTIKSY